MATLLPPEFRSGLEPLHGQQAPVGTEGPGPRRRERTKTKFENPDDWLDRPPMPIGRLQRPAALIPPYRSSAVRKMSGQLQSLAVFPPSASELQPAKPAQ